MNTTLPNALRNGVATFVVGAALLAGPAFAQQAPAAQTTATQTAADAEPVDSGAIVVTGSISRNPAAATASPIVSITSDDIAKRGITTTTELLQSLTANNAGTVPPSWSAFGFTTGASTPSLRGFNDAYTLVLFDGMRTAYYPLADDTQRQIVDINTIPSGIVSSVDTLLDGASSTYGSDAIAGVVNIITQRQIKGLHLNASAGISQRKDAGERRISGSYGYGDLDEQGFNVYVAGEYQINDPVFLSQRGAPFNTANQSTICGTAAQGCLTNSIRNGIQYDGSYNGFQSTTAPFVRPYSPGLASLGGYQALSPAGCGNLTAVTLTPAQQAVNGTSGGQFVTPSTVCQQDLVKQYRMYNAQLSRRGFTLRGTAKLGENAQAYLMFNFYQTKTFNQTTPNGFAAATADGGQTVTVNRIFLPAYVCSSGTASVNAAGDLLASGCNATNGTLNPNNPYAASGNLARLLALADTPRTTRTNAKTYRISGGVTGSFGEGKWNYRLGATASKIDLDTQYDGYVYLQGLMDAIAKGTYNFATPSANTEAANQQVFPTDRNRSTSKLAQVMATLDHDFMQLGGGALNVAAMAQFRHEELNSPSANAPNNTNPTQRYYGINAVGVQGKRDIWSVGYQVAAPIVDQLTLRASGSYDHYSTGQSAFSPKFEAEFKPIQGVKLRGTYSRGFRAPNFSESFNLPATGYSNSNIVCGTNNTNPTYGAFCAAHASNPSYYQGGYSVGVTSSGNPNLKPEKSRSFTAGIVLQPLRTLTFTVDYWNTKVKNVIVAATATNDIFNQYYTNNGVVNVPGVTVTKGIADPQNPNALPLLGSIISSFKNANSFKGSGLDFSADARIRLSDGLTLQSKATASYLIRLEQTNEDGSVWRYDGSLGGCNVTSCSGAPRFRATWQNTFDFNDKGSFTLTANYTSSYSSIATDSGGIYGDCAASAAAGQQVVYNNGDPVQCRSKPVFYMDGHAEVKVGKNFTLYGDMLNILNTGPKYDPNAAYGLYQFNPAWSDRLFIGRYFRVGARVDF